jgi:hypothetical protein
MIQQYDEPTRGLGQLNGNFLDNEAPRVSRQGSWEPQHPGEDPVCGALVGTASTSCDRYEVVRIYIYIYLFLIICSEAF